MMAWLVPLTVALVAGLFSFWNLVLSKEQKISELRVAWIDGLREDLAAHIAAVFTVKYLVDVFEYQYGRRLKLVDLANAISESHREAATTHHRILLRLNPRNKAQKELIDELGKLREHFIAEKYDEACNCAVAIQKKGRSVLKEEWEHVKKGEPIFWRSKRAALVLIVSSVIALGVFGIYHTYTAATPVNGSASSPTASASPLPTASPTP